jgi:hypothetical protein
VPFKKKINMQSEVSNYDDFFFLSAVAFEKKSKKTPEAGLKPLYWMPNNLLQQIKETHNHEKHFAFDGLTKAPVSYHSNMAGRSL